MVFLRLCLCSSVRLDLVPTLLRLSVLPWLLYPDWLDRGRPVMMDDALDERGVETPEWHDSSESERRLWLPIE